VLSGQRQIAGNFVLGETQVFQFIVICHLSLYIGIMLLLP
jgi:hypothetical protein